jgi:hypothetical protein
MDMELLFGFLILAGLAWMVYFCIKGGNMMFGILLVSLWWLFVSFIGYHAGISSSAFLEANKGQVDKSFLQVITDIYSQGILNYGPNLMTVLFGAWFGSVLMETGVAAALIRRAVELGGDRPAVSACLLTIVVAAVFTSVFGIGAVIAIGVIVLPILLSLGISKLTACISYLFSVGAGLFVNATLTTGSLGLFARDASGEQIYFFGDYVVQFGWIGLVIALVFTLVLTFVLVSREQKTHAWAAPVDGGSLGEEEKFVPGYALITPVLPALALIVPTLITKGKVNLPIIPVFTLIAFLVFALCRRLTSLKESGSLLSKTFSAGLIDSAALIGFLSFLNVMPSILGYAGPYLSNLLRPIIPESNLVLAIIIAVLAPLALFRGPLTIFGAGGAVMMIIYAMGHTTYNFLFPLMWITSMTMNLMACITQSYVAWAVGYTKLEPIDYLKKSGPFAWILAILLIAACYLVLGRA